MQDIKYKQQPVRGLLIDDFQFVVQLFDSDKHDSKPPFLSNERVSGYKMRGIVLSWEKDEKINYLLMSIRMIGVQKLREKLLADSAYTAAFYHSFADIDFLRTFRPGNS